MFEKSVGSGKYPDELNDDPRAAVFPSIRQLTGTLSSLSALHNVGTGGTAHGLSNGNGRIGWQHRALHPLLFLMRSKWNRHIEDPVSRKRVAIRKPTHENRSFPIRPAHLSRMSIRTGPEKPHSARRKPQVPKAVRFTRRILPGWREPRETSAFGGPRRSTNSKFVVHGSLSASRRWSHTADFRLMKGSGYAIGCCSFRIRPCPRRNTFDPLRLADSRPRIRVVQGFQDTFFATRPLCLPPPRSQ